MKEVLADIQSGKFTKQWMDECKNGQKNFLATRAKLAEHPVEKVGANLRAMMLKIGLNEVEAAENIENAIDRVLSRGFRTADLNNGSCKVLSCSEIGEKIIDEI